MWTASDQLWQSDITYIRLREAFVYLAVVLDAYSRRVVGWRLGTTLKAELAVGALRDALELRRPARGGCIIPTKAQYASAPMSSCWSSKRDHLDEPSAATPTTTRGRRVS